MGEPWVTLDRRLYIKVCPECGLQDRGSTGTCAGSLSHGHDVVRCERIEVVPSTQLTDLREAARRYLAAERDGPSMACVTSRSALRSLLPESRDPEQVKWLFAEPEEHE